MNTVILELSNDIIRLGVNKESSPRCILPSILNNKSHINREYIVRYLSYLFVDCLQLKTKDCRILVIENIVGDKYIRELVFEVCLVHFQFHSISFQPAIFLSILASNCLNGLVISVNGNEGNVIAIYDGRPIQQSLQFTSIGIIDCLREFQMHLEIYMGMQFDSSVVKELFFQIASIEPEFDLYPNLSEMQSTVVTGVTVLPMKDLNKSSCLILRSIIESSFLPLIHGISRTNGLVDDFGGMVGAVLNCLRECNVDIRHQVASNIIFCGDESDIPGLGLAICKEMTRLCNEESNMIMFKSLLTTLPNMEFAPRSSHFTPSLLSWIGGSLFASLKTNDKKFVTLNQILSLGGSAEVASNIPDWLSSTEKDWKFYGPCNDINYHESLDYKNVSVSNISSVQKKAYIQEY